MRLTCCVLAFWPMLSKFLVKEPYWAHSPLKHSGRSFARRGGLRMTNVRTHPVTSHPDTDLSMKVHLIDGTYELFRHFFAVPSSTDASGQEIGATRGVLASVSSMVEQGATHIGV